MIALCSGIDSDAFLSRTEGESCGSERECGAAASSGSGGGSAGIWKRGGYGDKSGEEEEVKVVVDGGVEEEDLIEDGAVEAGDGC
ncbi:MAG: hypothetical protein ACPIOQ_43160 [Promethearchaeia archaeon]